MNELTKDRTVVYLDTNSLHYLDLFLQFVQNSDFTIDDIGSRELATQLEQVEEVGYRKSIQKGCRIISFVLQEDAQVEFSQVSNIELLCGRVRGAAIENAARQGIPDRMWSRIGEHEIRDWSNETGLQRIRTRIADLGSTLKESGVFMGIASEGKRVLDILELATVIVGHVYMSATDSIVYASAIAARADLLITGDGYLSKTVNLIHNPSGRARYDQIQQHLESLSGGTLPKARDCGKL